MIQIRFTSPEPGSHVGPTTFTVTGSWDDDGQPDGIFDGFYVTSVLITLAPGGASVPAALHPDNTFSAELTLPADTQHDDPVTVTCAASVVMTSNSDPGENGQQSSATGAPLDLVADKARDKQVTIGPFVTPVTPTTLPYRLELAGTASDTWNKITKVQLKVNTADPVDVEVDGVHQGTWLWHKPVELPDTGQYTFTVLATLGDLPAPVTATRVLSIREPF